MLNCSYNNTDTSFKRVQLLWRLVVVFYLASDNFLAVLWRAQDSHPTSKAHRKETITITYWFHTHTHIKKIPPTSLPNSFECDMIGMRSMCCREQHSITNQPLLFISSTRASGEKWDSLGNKASQDLRYAENSTFSHLAKLEIRDNIVLF